MSVTQSKLYVFYFWEDHCRAVPERKLKTEICISSLITGFNIYEMSTLRKVNFKFYLKFKSSALFSLHECNKQTKNTLETHFKHSHERQKYLMLGRQLLEFYPTY